MQNGIMLIGPDALVRTDCMIEIEFSRVTFHQAFAYDRVTRETRRLPPVRVGLIDYSDEITSIMGVRPSEFHFVGVKRNKFLSDYQLRTIATSDEAREFVAWCRDKFAEYAGDPAYVEDLEAIFAPEVYYGVAS